MEGLAVCAPVVTAPALQSVPQLAAGMYARMGLARGLGATWTAAAPEAARANASVSLVARNVDDYVAAALELVASPGLRLAWRKAICAARHLLFDDRDSVDEWAEFLVMSTSAFGRSPRWHLGE